MLNNLKYYALLAMFVFVFVIVFDLSTEFFAFFKLVVFKNLKDIQLVLFLSVALKILLKIEVNLCKLICYAVTYRSCSTILGYYHSKNIIHQSLSADLTYNNLVFALQIIIVFTLAYYSFKWIGRTFPGPLAKLIKN